MAEGFDVAGKLGERMYEAELYRIKGELLLRQSVRAKEEAEACFHLAIETARRQGAKLLELRATASLGRLWGEHGRKAEARQTLSEIYGWFTNGFDAADLKEAKVLLAELA